MRNKKEGLLRKIGETTKEMIPIAGIFYHQPRRNRAFMPLSQEEAIIDRGVTPREVIKGAYHAAWTLYLGVALITGTNVLKPKEVYNKFMGSRGGTVNYEQPKELENNRQQD